MAIASASESSRSTVDPFEDESDEQLLKLMSGPLEHYCASCLKITTKDGQLIPFVWNRAQRFLHTRIEAQQERTKMVRMLVLKGRKVGISTYVAARAFRRAHALMDTSIYILAHEDEASGTLFSIAKTYYNHLKREWRPVRGKANDKQMTFPVMRCKYTVGTAGGKGSARSQTTQFFHGSEVGFWPNAKAHMAGAVQTVGRVPGTEIILESTANGIGNEFHEMWLKAERGEGDYECCFIPWFWDEDLQQKPPAGWVPIEEEAEQQRLHKLTDAQAYWMHLKNIELGGKPGKIFWLFKQEYPGTAQEAFQSSGGEGIVRTEDVLAARKAIHIVPNDDDARLLGVDCAANVTKGDSTHLMSRQGRVAGHMVNFAMKTDRPMEIVGKIVEFHEIHRFHMIFIDVGYVGKAVYDRLLERGFGNVVTAVEYGGDASDKERFRNKRAEIYMAGAEWFKLPGGVRCPDDDVFHRHACSIDRKPSSDKRILMRDKEWIKDQFGFSPDRWDAFCNTFAEKVIVPEVHRLYGHRGTRRRGSWMAG